MTIPYERTLAVLRARELLMELARADDIDPDVLCREAAAILKHFPTLSDVDAAAAKAPSVFAKTDSGWIG
ncbi:BPSL0761 family protein [Paraburkholderia silviterrae]|uniref:BPSL0761 family protein n=1 Tax=Paraburkholderia silviterrae TaxID=2528715 RepID=UPI00362EB990